MADNKKLSALTSFDPMKDGQLLLVSEQKDGAWKSGKVSTNTIAQYVMPAVLGKLKGADNITVLAVKEDPKYPEKITGYQITHTLDTQLFVVCPDGRPVTGASNKIYLVPDASSTGENIYIEWAYTDNKWEEIGRRQVKTDLSGYYTKDQVDGIKSALESSISTVNGKVSTNTTNIATNTQDITSLSGKVNVLETESATHALKTDLDNVKAAQEKDAANIVTLNDKIGKHTVPADGETAEVPGTGLLKELEDLEAGYKAADTSLSRRIKANEDKLKTVATTTELSALKNRVDGHDSSISTITNTLEGKADASDVIELENTINGKLDGKVDKTTLNNYVTTETLNLHKTTADEKYALKSSLSAYITTTAADSKYITPAGVDAKINALNLNSKFDDKASVQSVTDLTAKVTTLEGKDHYTKLQIDGFIDTKIAYLASKTYVDDQIAKADISGKLTEYAKTADVANTYATKTSVEDITKTDGTIDTKVNAAKADLQGKLDKANATISDLTAKLQALTAKLAKYDARFGYNSETDTWSKSFLLIEE